MRKFVEQLESRRLLTVGTDFADFDFSGTVDTNDFNILAANFGKDQQSFSEGNANFTDSTVDSVDYNIMAAQFGNAVPYKIVNGTGQTWSTLAAAAAGASNGDVIRVHGGSYNGPITFSQDNVRWVEWTGETVVIDGNDSTACASITGSSNVFYGFTFSGGNGDLEAANAAVQVRDEFTELNSCLVTHNAAEGVGVMADDCYIYDSELSYNGQDGFSVSGYVDTSPDPDVPHPIDNFTMRRTEIQYNNTGVNSIQVVPGWSANSNKKVNGNYYYVDPTYQAGGGKVFVSTDAILDHVYSHNNIGPGLWTDYANVNTEITYCEVANNDGGVGSWTGAHDYDGVGIKIELSRPDLYTMSAANVLVDHNVTYDNKGAGLHLYIADGVTVTNNDFVTTDSDVHAVGIRYDENDSTGLDDIDVHDNYFYFATVEYWTNSSGDSLSGDVTMDYDVYDDFVQFRWSLFSGYEQYDTLSGPNGVVAKTGFEVHGSVI